MKKLITILFCLTIFSCSKKGKDNGNNTGGGGNNHGAMIYDASGNSYDTVEIYGKVWLTKNLATTKYNNGDDITCITDKNVWLNYTLGAYCRYNNSTAYSDIYGMLYNGYCVSDPRGIAPAGFHVASQADWQALVTYLGGVIGTEDSVAGGKMKEAGLARWVAPNTGATNSSGFTSLPAGWLGVNGYYAEGEGTIWWSSTYYAGVSSYFCMSNGTGHSGAKPLFSLANNGYSVRCVKD